MSQAKSQQISAQFSRTLDMLGHDGFRRLSESRVVVVGLGGVGSHAIVALARSGLRHFRLIDFDKVTLTSLNRHAVALPADVGLPKVEVMTRWLEQLNPEVDVEGIEAFFDDKTAPELLAGSPDIVLDAIDSLNPKVTLLKICVEMGLKVVSSMGASSRTDPTQVRIAPLADTERCPLARQVRKRLRRRGVTDGITAIYSLEAGRPPLPPDETEERLDRGRIRNRLPSLSTIPAVFGCSLASVAINELAGEDTPPRKP